MGYLDITKSNVLETVLRDIDNKRSSDTQFSNENTVRLSEFHDKKVEKSTVTGGYRRFLICFIFFLNGNRSY